MQSTHDVLTKACRATLSIFNAKTTSRGSGVVVAPGLAVTNRHVVAGAGGTLAGSVEATTEDEVFTAPVLKACRTLDLAFLKVPPGIPALDGAGPGGHLLGEEIYAIGFSDGTYERTVTRGIVSKLETRLELNRYLQFDAPIHQGNSGGPVINRRGEILGLVSRGSNPCGLRIASTLNLAIPWQLVGRKIREFTASVDPDSSRMCLACGWPNRAGKYCEQCGSSLADPAEIVSREKSGFHAACPACGREREGERRYCNGCGASLRKEEEDGLS